jgi:hypothetical protein
MVSLQGDAGHRFNPEWTVQVAEVIAILQQELWNKSTVTAHAKTSIAKLPASFSAMRRAALG